MSHNGNWFAVSRLIFDHPVVGIHDRAFTELEAWLWLLAEAAFETQKVYNKGTVIMLDPGQIMHARVYLAKRWQWSEDKVRWFLKRLQTEAMIARFCTQQTARTRTNQIQIISICNYGQYQFSSINQQQAAAPPPTPSQSPASPQRTPSQHPQANNSTPKQEDSPLPPDGGTAGESATLEGGRKSAVRKTAAAAKLAAAAEAIEIYNSAAKQFKFRICATLTPARLSRMVKRLEDIGGVDKFRQALWAVCQNDWLMGRVVRKGETPFKLDIDRLMQTDGNMGDVLANLLDADSEISARKTGNELRPDWWVGEEGAARLLPSEWWRNAITRYANGMWPVQFLGPGPWDGEKCLVPAPVQTEFSLPSKYPSADGACAFH